MNNYLRIRYVFDRLFALVLILLLSPVILLLSLITFYTQGEILFAQNRSGLRGKPFTMLKFKTMTDDATLPEPQRINAWGQWLRKTGLDELPQLFHVASGSMVFIGPRPLLPAYDERYNGVQKLRLNIKPGLTGYAQAMHRNRTTWEQRFEDDVYYVKHASLWLDIKILFHSLKRITDTQPEPILDEFR